MSKPWDHMRQPVKTPICAGNWHTTDQGAFISVRWIEENYVKLSIGGHFNCHCFHKSDLTELIEFLEELREQLQ